MGRRKDKEKQPKRNKLLPRFLRSVVAVVLLSSLILGITVVVKGISEANSEEVSGSIESILRNSKSDLSKDDAMSKIINFLEKFIRIPKKTSNDLSSDLSKDASSLLIDNDNTASSSSNDNENVLFRACIISDIHQDTTNLSRSLEKVTENDCMLLFVIGDVTNYGDVNTLSSIKTILDNSGIKDYYVIPGDHDLAQSVSLENFEEVFGDSYHFVEFADVRFLMMDNSANYTPVNEKKISWMEENIKNADFVVLSQPLYVNGLNAPFSSIYMGSTRNDPDSLDLKEKQQVVKDQGAFILSLLRDTKNVKAVISGEHHRSSVLIDSVRSDLKHYVIGAVTSTVNDYPQSAIQSSRVSVMSIFDDKSYSIEDVSID
ncbi:MAG: metallophosphoesterase [Patescibacteria group bacterium]